MADNMNTPGVVTPNEVAAFAPVVVRVTGLVVVVLGFYVPPTAMAIRRPVQDWLIATGEMKKLSSDDDIGTRCGIGRYRPDWLQVLNNPKVSCTLLGIYIFFHGGVLTGTESVNTTTLEKRFQLSSVQIAWMSSANHISAATIGTLASFYATNRKPRWLALSAAVGSLGLVLSGSPHFLTGPYEPQGIDDDWNICRPNRTTCADTEDSDLSNYLYFLMFGNFLCGISGSMILTVGISLIDDSMPATKSPIYIGLVCSMWFVGMAVGYVLGGQALKLYVDFDIVSTESLTIESSDVRWVGAWWLSWFIAAGVYVLLFVTFLLYGSELPTARKLRLEKKVREKQGDTVNVIEIGDSTRGQTECNSNKKISDDEKGSWKNTESSLKDKDSLKNMSIKIISLTIDGKNTKSIIETLAVTEAEANGNIKPEISNNGTNNETDNVTNVTGNELTFEIIVNEDQHSSKHLKERRSIKIFVPLFFKLLSSPTVVFLDLSVSLIFLFQTSIGLFLPKIIQNLFNQSTTTAGLLPGVFIVPGIAIGQFLGGFITKRLGLLIRGCFNLALLCSIVAAPTSIVWLLYCDRNDIYGLDAPYKVSTLYSTVSATMLSSCNQYCSCRPDVYEPICDESPNQFYSPCYAGCTGVTLHGYEEVYTNCSCLPGFNRSLVAGSNICGRSCDGIYYALPIMLIGILLLNIVFVQVQTIIIRLHTEEDKAFALGIMWLFIRALGMIPGPLLLGLVLDAACDIWGKSCAQEVTSCLIYDNEQAARNLSLFSASLAVGLVLSMLLAFTCYKMSTRSKSEPSQ